MKPTSNRKPRFRQIEGIPTWALYALEYGMDEDATLSDEDRSDLDAFLAGMEARHLRYVAAYTENDGFTPYPLFGLACDTFTGTFEVVA